MTKRTRTISIIAICAIVALFVVALVSPEAVASSEEKPHFVAKTDDGVNWDLYLDGVKLDYASASGRFIDYNNPNAVSVKFFKAIEQELVSRGIIDAAHGNLTEYYDIEFQLPLISRPEIDKTSAEYSTSSGITVSADYAAVISVSATRLQYKNVQSEGYSDLYAQSAGSGLLFAGVDVGEYDVRYAVTETFEFDGATRVAIRYSEPVRCSVTKATLEKPIFQDMTIVYGDSVSKIASNLKSLVTDEKMIADGGEFLPSAEQTDEAFANVTNIADLMLPASDRQYTLLFDYIAGSANYENVDNVQVKVSVEKRDVYVYISDAFSLVGEELVPLENVEFYVDESRLATGDDVASVGVTLYYSDDVNKDVASNAYRIYATCSNQNYTAVSRNMNSTFVDGGRYVVYPKEVAIAAPDGRTFIVSSDEGFANFKTARVEVVSVEGVKPYDGARAICAYRIVLTDNYGNVVEPEEPYFVAWASNPNGAKWLAVEGENALLDIESVGGVLKFDRAENVIAFYGEPPVESFEWTSATIALLTIACTLACVTVALVSVLILKRRFLK